ncbi:MAG: hypothetical protein HQ519_01600 [Planctomycetes bacterium]|nr:hypothetical protein [Planctomycetota bacterium]
MLATLPYRPILLSLLFFAVSPCATAFAALQSPDPGQLKILYTEHPGLPQNEVPGIPGATFYQYGRPEPNPSFAIGDYWSPSNHQLEWSTS